MFEQPAVQRLLAQARRQSYRPRQLMLRGGNGGELFLLLEGSASLILEHDSGKQAVLGHLHPGDFFGERSLCAERGGESMTVRARSPAVAAVLDAQNWRRMLQRDPALALTLIDQLALRLDGAYRQIGDQFFLDVTARLHRLLLRLSRAPDAQAVDAGAIVHLNRLELATMLGCSREMIARGLRALEADGRVKANGHALLVRLTAPDPGAG
jgi:CRP/FNR family transcriptional regulator, cyclic AMP receptor protein